MQNLIPLGLWWRQCIPKFAENGLDAINCADWLKGLILDGIVAGVGAVLGFVPQMLVLFILLAFLESCGYMACTVSVLTEYSRKFGLRQIIYPYSYRHAAVFRGIMASRTIEMTVTEKSTIIINNIYTFAVLRLRLLQ